MSLSPVARFIFLAGKEKPTRPEAARIQKIAEKNGCIYFETALPPGPNFKHWFSAPDKGKRQNTNLEKAVRADLEEAGLLREHLIE